MLAQKPTWNAGKRFEQFMLIYYSSEREFINEIAEIIDPDTPQKFEDDIRDCLYEYRREYGICVEIVRKAVKEFYKEVRTKEEDDILTQSFINNLPVILPEANKLDYKKHDKDLMTLIGSRKRKIIKELFKKTKDNISRKEVGESLLDIYYGLEGENQDIDLFTQETAEILKEIYPDLKNPERIVRFYLQASTKTLIFDKTDSIFDMDSYE